MRRQPKPLDRRRLEAGARHHLERWSASRAHLERLLLRRVDRAIGVHGGDRDEAVAWIRDILDRLEAEGTLSDDRLARDRARRLNERGVSSRAIRARLFEKGIGGPAVGQALADLGESGQDPDLRAAATYVRKRRLGPFRQDPSAWRERDLARLARAGFPVRTALRVLDAPDVAALEAIELGLDEEAP